MNDTGYPLNDVCSEFPFWDPSKLLNNVTTSLLLNETKLPLKAISTSNRINTSHISMSNINSIHNNTPLQDGSNKVKNEEKIKEINDFQKRLVVKEQSSVSDRCLCVSFYSIYLRDDHDDHVDYRGNDRTCNQQVNSLLISYQSSSLEITQPAPSVIEGTEVKEKRVDMTNEGSISVQSDSRSSDPVLWKEVCHSLLRRIALSLQSARVHARYISCLRVYHSHSICRELLTPLLNSAIKDYLLSHFDDDVNLSIPSLVLIPTRDLYGSLLTCVMVAINIHQCQTEVWIREGR